MPVVDLNNSELQKLMAETPDLLLLDVRTPEEFYGLGHIPGARLLPIHLLPDNLGGLDPEKPVAVICEHGVHSADASFYLARKGFKQVYNLSAGMAEWNGDRTFAS